MSDINKNSSDIVVSFCKIKNEGSHIFLYRLADVVGDKIVNYVPYVWSETILYRNISKIEIDPVRDAEIIDREYGMWELSSMPDTGSSNGILCEYSLEQRLPIPIWIVTGFENLESLGKALINSGIKQTPPVCFSSLQNYSTILIGVARGKSYQCYICSHQDITENHGRFYFSETIIRCPYCNINRSETLKIDGQTFYRYLTPPISPNQERKWIRRPLEAVKIVLSAYITESTLTDLNIANTESHCKEILRFIREMGTETLYRKYADVANVTEEKAKEFFDEFKEYLDKYDGDLKWIRDLILNAYNVIPELRETIHDHFRPKLADSFNDEINKLKQQHEEEISRLEQKHKDDLERLRGITEQLANAEKRLTETKTELNEASAARDIILSELQNARENTADFVQSAFPVWALSTISKENKQDDIAAKVIHTGPTIVSNALFKRCTDIESVISIIHKNLESAGVKSRFCGTLACLMFAARQVSLPILLAGPNGDAIADAFSAGVVGDNALRLDGTYPFNLGILKELDKYRDQVLLIHSPLSRDWCEHLQEITQLGLNVIAIHPYREDLEVVPKSTFSQCLPIFSELMIKSLPRRDFIYRDGSSPLNSPPSATSFDYKGFCEDLLQAIGVSCFTKNRLLKLLSHFHSLNEQHEETEYLLAVFALGWLTVRRKKGFKNYCVRNVDGDLVKELFDFVGLVDEQ